MRASCLSVASFFALTSLGLAAVTGVNTLWTDNGNAGTAMSTPLTNNLGVPLNIGTAANGDGTVIQIGYFAGVPITDPDLDTPGDPSDPNEWGPAEWATFTALTGHGSNNFGLNHPIDGPIFNTSMGDGTGAPSGFLLDGFYSIGVTFDTVANPTLADLPVAPSRVGIRFYDGFTEDASTFFNTVTVNDGSWILNPPADPFAVSANASLDAFEPPSTATSELIWESGPSGAFSTVIPEPSSSLLALLGALVLLRRRR